MKKKGCIWKQGLAAILSVAMMLGSVELPVLAVEVPGDDVVVAPEEEAEADIAMTGDAPPADGVKLPEITAAPEDAGKTAGMEEEVGVEIAEANDTAATGEFMSFPGITWQYDAASKTLTISGEGKLHGVWFKDDNDNYVPRSPFNMDPNLDMDDVRKIKFDNCKLTEKADMLFYGLEDVTQIDLSGLDTTDVRNMDGMFQGCSGLNSLDLSPLITDNVESMVGMFQGCTGLSSLNVSTFNTFNVRSMVSMFYNCSGLTSLNINSFNTIGVGNMSGMFTGCSELQTLELDIDTSAVTNMSFMFYGCSSLTSLDVSHFNTESVTNMSGMFYGCSSLGTLDLTSFDTSGVTDMKLMFGGCSKLQQLRLNTFDLSKISIIDGFFDGCDKLEELWVPYMCMTDVALPKEKETDKWYDIGRNELTVIPKKRDTSEIIKKNKYPEITIVAEGEVDEDYGQIRWTIDSLGKLTVEGEGDFDEPTDVKVTNRAPWYDDRNKITSAVVKVSGMTDASCMFAGCENLRSVDASSFDMYSMENMHSMFSECHSLEKLQGWEFYAPNVTDLSYMFYDCRSLESLDLSYFETSNVTDMSYMFWDCYGLTDLDMSGWDTSNVTNMAGMFADCHVLAGVDVGHFDTSKAKDVSKMFYFCTMLQELDLSSFVLSEGTKANDLLHVCTELTTLFTPSVCKVANIELGDYWYDSDGNELIYLPEGTRSIKLQRGLVPDKKIASGEVNEEYGKIAWMIDENGKLTVEGTGDFAQPHKLNAKRAPWYAYKNRVLSVDINLSGTIDTSFMFSGCRNLTSVDFSDFDTKNVVNMNAMFKDCAKLTDLDLRSFDTSNVTVMQFMFEGCSSLKNLNVSKFNTSKVGFMDYMFDSCSSLETLDLGSFDVSGVINMGRMFLDCQSLTSLDLKGFKTSSATNMTSMFSGCSSLTSLNVGNFVTDKVTGMDCMFAFCENLKKLDLSSFDTRKVLDMTGMFQLCYSLEDLNISGFDTSNVTGMNCMFSYCESLKALDLSRFDMSHVTDIDSMFYECTELETIGTPLNCSLDVFLPGEEGVDIWYDSDKNTYTKLPDKTTSIELTKNRVPDPASVIYTVTFDPMGGTISTKSVKVTAAKKRIGTAEYVGYISSIPQPQKEAYTFKGWFLNEEGTGDALGTRTPITKNVTFFAKWEAKTANPEPDPTPTENVSVTGVTLDKTSASLKVGETVQLTATVAPDDATDKTVTWVSSDTKVAIVEGGLVSAVAAGTAAIMVTTNDKEFSASCTVTVTEIPSEPEEPEDPSLTYYIVEFVMNGHGTQVAEQEVGEGRKVKKPADPVAEGYEFLGWYRNVACTKAWDFDRDTIKTATRIYADWEKVKAEELGDSDDNHYKDYQGDRNNLKAIGAVVGNIKAVTYSGVPHEPAVKVTYKNGKKKVTLTEGTDYTVSFKNNVNAGTGEVVVAGCGAYTGEITKTFIIKPKSVKKLKVVVGGMSMNDRSGELPIHVYDGDVLLADNIDYTLAPRDITSSAGKKAVSITGKGNYDSSTSRAVKVMVYAADKVLRAEDFELDEDTWMYTGKAIKPGVNSLNDLEKKYYSVKYSNNTNAGIACVTISGKKGYTGEVVLNFRILPMEGTFHVNNDNPLKAVTYNGKRQKPKVKVTADVMVSGTVKRVTLKEGRDYTVTYRNNLHATPDESSAFVIITGKGNCENVDTKSAAFKINPQDISKAKIAGVEDDYVVTYGKQTLLPGTDYTFVEYGARKGGKVEVKLKGKGDFTGSFAKMVKEK